MNKDNITVPTLEFLAEEYAKKTGAFSIGELQAYLRCGYLKASQIINRMKEANLLELNDNYLCKWIG